ncbi:MAG: tetratricopeptide repeat protein [Betaproteobacteria bacterium]|nr:tetratricopeptide repeat protein [Betaproteobacteria bacterium]
MNSSLQRLITRLFTLLYVLTLSACAQMPAGSIAQEKPGASTGNPPATEAKVAAAPGKAASPEAAVSPHEAESEAAANLPKLELTPQLLYRLLLAEIAATRGDLSVAVGAYQELAKSTRDPRVAKRAAEIALYARQPDAALDAARIWVEADPESMQAQQMLAGLLLGAQRPDEAEVHLAKLLALDSGGSPAANPERLGEALLRIGRLLARYPDKAVVLRLIDQLTSPYTSPYENIAEAHFARAQAAAGAKNDVRALAEIERARTLRPDWEQAVLFKAQLQQRVSSTLAMETLQNFLAAHPKAQEVRMVYARSLIGEKRYEDARREFDKLLAENPDNGEVIYSVALLSLQLNDLAPAEKYFKQLLELGFGDLNPPRYYLGQIAESNKKYPEALQWYRAVTPSAQYLPAQARAAGLLAQLGRLDEGRQLLHQAAVNNPNYADALLITESQLLNNADRVADAYALLDRQLATQPDQPELLYESALLAEKLGKMDVTERNLRKLIRLKPDNAHAYNALGYSFADHGQHLDEAGQLIDKALELAPSDPFIMDSKGWLLYRRGDLSGAIDILSKALALRADPEIAAHLGEVQWVAGRHDEAKKTWDDAAKASPANGALAAAIKKFSP